MSDTEPVAEPKYTCFINIVALLARASAQTRSDEAHLAEAKAAIQRAETSNSSTTPAPSR